MSKGQEEKKETKKKPAKTLKEKRQAKKEKKSGGKKKTFTIDCTDPVQDDIFDIAAFEKFLQDRIKVNGKAGVLGSKVKISVNKAKIAINAQLPFSKRYLKYLTKKYLKKNQIRDWLRVIAVGKNTYQVRYFKIHEREEETADEQ